MDDIHNSIIDDYILDKREEYRLMIYNHGLAEALGVSQDQLENMSIREFSARAYELGGALK